MGGGEAQGSGAAAQISRNLKETSAGWDAFAAPGVPEEGPSAKTAAARRKRSRSSLSTTLNGSIGIMTRLLLLRR